MPRKELNKAQVQAIRFLYRLEFPMTAVRYITGMSKSAVWDVCQRITWKDVEDRDFELIEALEIIKN